MRIGVGTDNLVGSVASGRSALRRMSVKVRTSNAFGVVRLLIVTSVGDHAKVIGALVFITSGIQRIFQLS
jgi:hypothetical protein